MKTLNEQIERVRELLRKCYGVVASKNGIVPEVGERNMENLPNAIASTHDTLEELTITQNGEYTPQDGVDGFSKVTAQFDTSSLPKVKVFSFRVTNECINYAGRWEGEKLIDTSEVTSFRSAFDGVTNLKHIDVRDWNTENVKDFIFCFFNTGLTEIDLSNWEVKNVTNISGLLNSAYNLTYCDVSTWNTRNIAQAARPFNGTNIKTIDFSHWELPNITNMIGINGLFFGMHKLTNFIGGKTIEDVLTNNITALKDIKVSIDSINDLVDRASLRALINGLADLIGQTTQTLTLGATLIAKLTEEDIAIATNKNWTIV